MVRLLVTGGDCYDDRDGVFVTLDWAHDRWSVSHLIHKGATSTDMASVEWCESLGIPHAMYSDKADFREVIDQQNPDVVILFPGESNVARSARRAGLPVYQLNSYAQHW